MFGVDHVSNDHGCEKHGRGHVHECRDCVQLCPERLRVVDVVAGEVPPDGSEVHHLSRLPDQEITPSGTGEHSERNQPQHVLGRVDLPGEHESRDHEEGDLRQARSALSGEREHGDSDEQGDERAGGNEVQPIGRYRGYSENTGGVPHGTEVDATISIEGVEVPPAIPVREGEGHVDNEPCSRSAADQDQYRPPPSTA